MVALFAAACEKPAPPPPPPPEVYVTDVIQRDVPVYLELVGQNEGYQDIDLRARVEGFLESVTFQEGTFVHKGDILYQIDRKPFETAVAGAKADRPRRRRSSRRPTTTSPATGRSSPSRP